VQKLGENGSNGSEAASLLCVLVVAKQTLIQSRRQSLFGTTKLRKQAVTRSWNNGPTEGQINRLKMLKRAMDRRAGVELLQAHKQKPGAFGVRERPRARRTSRTRPRR
jgi:hypothetical protein